MFNPFKVELTCPISISTGEQEKFLEFVKSQLLAIGCDRSWREGSKVLFSNNLFGFSRGRHHVMAGVNGGGIGFGPASQLTYEYRITTLGITMLIFAGFALLIFGLSLPSDPGYFPFFFLGIMVFVLGINWTVIRYRQNKFIQQLEPDYHRMKQVFSQPR